MGLKNIITGTLTFLTINENRFNFDYTKPPKPNYETQTMDAFSSYNETKERELEVKQTLMY